MFSLLRSLLSIIFPVRNDAVIVSALKDADIERLYQLQNVSGVHCLSVFQTAEVRALIHEAKFHRNETAWMLCGKLLALQLVRLKIKDPILIPIPLSKTRKRERGYNQTEKIARAAVRITPRVKVFTDLLVRIRDTDPQTSLKRHERLWNVKDAFDIHNEAEVRNILLGKHVILFDDVTTTGATMGEAKATLTQYSPASITCIALAH